MLKIEQVEFRPDYKLYIVLTNHEILEYDMKKELRKARFMDISDLEVFLNGVVVQKKIIRWNDATEITLEELLNKHKNI